MHESLLAHEIVESIMAVAHENAAIEIVSIKIGIGRLTHVNPDQLLFCLQILTRNSIAGEAEFEFEFISPTGRCVCGYKNEIEPENSDEKCDFNGYNQPVHEYIGMTCPHCSRAIELAGGNDLIIQSIEIEK
ncbi:hydrogenase expression/synthesis HypA [Methanosalsum zhilinae DSM 4017]|uniref:Hydrogenase maturation factor HypA n=2 Tax=Methanosalsum zhilinae TaxID=39669 RepID=F7XLC3_METZD|nr:hydrogenase expression/synthesis HypA [Methanosalsum zhilinae DSM 4017]